MPAGPRPAGPPGRTPARPRRRRGQAAASRAAARSRPSAARRSWEPDSRPVPPQRTDPARCPGSPRRPGPPRRPGTPSAPARSRAAPASPGRRRLGRVAPGAGAPSSASSCSTTWASTSTSTRRSTGSTRWPPTARRCWPRRCRRVPRPTSSSAAGCPVRTARRRWPRCWRRCRPTASRAVLVSFPPTALVDTPACRTPDGSLRNPTTEAFASSLLEGGPSCMVRAVQQLSGLRIDHYLGVDLARLPGMVDALGGVPVCVIPSAATEAAATPLPRRPLRAVRRGGRRLPGAGRHRRRRDRRRGRRAGPAAADLDAARGDVDEHARRPADPDPVPQPRRRRPDRRRADHAGRPAGPGRRPSATSPATRCSAPACRWRRSGYVPAGTDQAYVLLDGGGHPRPLRRRDRGQPGTRGAHHAAGTSPPWTAPRRTRRRPRQSRPPKPAPAAAGGAHGAAVRGHGGRPQRHRDDGAGGHGRRPAARPGLRRRRGRQRGRDGQRERRPPRAERARAGPHGGRGGARRGAAAQRLDRRHGPAGHRPGLLDRRPGEVGAPPADGTLPEPEAVPTTPAPAPVSCG